MPAGALVLVLAAAVRRHIPPLGDDRYLKRDLDAALRLVEDGSVLREVEAAVGVLA